MEHAVVPGDFKVTRQSVVGSSQISAKVIERNRCNVCNIGLCPKGITSQNTKLYRRLDPDQVAQRVADVFMGIRIEMKKIMAPLGRSQSLPIGMSDAIGIDDKAAADKLQIKYVC